VTFSFGMMYGILRVAYWTPMAVELSMMQGPPLDRSFPLSFVTVTDIGLMLGPRPLWRFSVGYRKLILVILISWFGILEAVYSQVLKLGKKIRERKLLVDLYTLVWFSATILRHAFFSLACFS
jgi:hypothetical protein